MSNRSGTNFSAPTDSDRRPVLLGASTVDGVTPVAVEANPATGALLVETVTSGGNNVNLVQVGGSNITLGQTTKSASLPVTLASDQNNALETGGNLAASKSDLDQILANQTNGQQQATLTDVYVALKSLINVMVSPPWKDPTTGALKATMVGTGSANQTTPYVTLSGIWNSTSGTASTGGTASGYSTVDSLINPLNKQSWALNIRERIN